MNSPCLSDMEEDQYTWLLLSQWPLAVSGVECRTDLRLGHIVD